MLLLSLSTQICTNAYLYIVNLFASSPKQFLNDCLPHLILKKHLSARSYVCIRLLIFRTSVLPFFCVFVDNQLHLNLFIQSLVLSHYFEQLLVCPAFFLKENWRIADVAIQKPED